MKKTVLLILSALLLGACAPRTTTQPAEAPKQQDRYSVKSMMEAFLAPVLEGNIDYMLADENRECYGIIEGSSANGFRLKQLLADPQKRDAVLDALRKSAQDVKSRIYGSEIKESEEIQSAPPRPNMLYTVRLYARVYSYPQDENRSFSIMTELDGPRARLCAVKDVSRNGLIDLYQPYIFGVVNKYGK
ncbi:hypothetical protein Mesil_3641 (plasmid) [Allomeiothermus silvanus DSM 9946]|uniref:Lipoprotein n=1 Tax=Allomeiothermus silvanus (strain ATCC 700542 / DSM 9946 / NBRC 106475 / NCIMB 13440 / VI-R2) TaxID=526227 RepID=D7BJS4_ALLS1|nr:hypothetical protein [Allomeiothermus silvanus]ADH65430.1 hypothetical protein Mesil_3641 [Allomeiothermus silvanus DSM 9946]